MEIPKSAISLSVVFWLAATSALEPEVDVEVTTEGFEFPTYEATANVTESPADNGMAIGEFPPEIHPDVPPQSKEEEEPPAVEQTPVSVTFPDNHKNFTPSEYLGDRDFPPYYLRLNPYQQQYKSYNEQKQMYSRKPIKFEESAFNNYYLPASPNSVEAAGGKKTENVRVNRNPFPYAFENERNRETWYGGESGRTPEDWQKEQHQSYEVNEKAPEKWHQQAHQQSYKINEKIPEGWYKYTGLLPPYENPPVLPYYPVPQDRPHENEIVHFGHHQLKKDEKGSAWKKVFHVLTALVPLGLILASLSPNVISINSTTTTKTTRQRSEDAPPAGRFKEEDVLKLMKKYGVESLNEAQCEDRILCELAVEGGRNSAGPIEKGFWFLANRTPWNVAEKAGMVDLFDAIKSGKCETYRCEAKTKSSGKKPTWKRTGAK